MLNMKKYKMRSKVEQLKCDFEGVNGGHSNERVTIVLI